MKETIFQMKAISEQLPPMVDLRFRMCGTTYPNRSYSITRPHAPLFCIEYVFSGTGQVQVGDQVFHPVAGDTYFLPQDTDQFYHSDRTDPWEKIWINLSGDFAKRLAAECGILNTYHYPGLDTSDILMKFQYYAARPEHPASAEKCMALVVELFLRLSRTLRETEPRKQTPVEKMLSYIEQHETDPISLEQLTAICKKSPSQAERLFRAEVGVPPYRYALTRKLELACQLLHETGMSVRDIASYLSFEDEFYFSGLFRRKIGVSPTEYRKRCENDTPGLQNDPLI